MLKKIQKGFTLIEMVIVISIIGVLAAILVPAILNYVHKAERAADKVTARLIGTTVVQLMIEYPFFEETFYNSASMTWDVCIDGFEYRFKHVARADGSKACYGRDPNETYIKNKDDPDLKQRGAGWEYIVDRNATTGANGNSARLTRILNSRLDEVIGGNIVNNSFIPMRSTGYKHPAKDANHDNGKKQDEKAQKRCKDKTYSYTDKWILGFYAGKKGDKQEVNGQLEVWAGDSYGKAATGPRVRLWPNPPSYY